MKVKQQSNHWFSFGRYQNSGLFRVLRMVLLGAASIGIALLLFFSVLKYGAQLKQMGTMAYLKRTAIQLVNLDFSFVKHTLEAQVQEFETMNIDIKFKHLLRIEYLKEQALETGIISPEAKNEEFPAQITYRGIPHDVDISLTGMIAMAHLKNPNKWSFQVKVKGDNTIDGMKRFGLLLPSSRGYLTDWLGYELMKEAGLMGLRVDFIDVSINGKSKGIYYLEERFDKHLVENNRLREGVLFKLDRGLSAYQETKLARNPETRSQLLRIKRMWQEVQKGEMEVNQFFDLRKMAKAFVVCDLMNNKHPLAIQNLRFYFNPVTGLAEPIAREWELLGRTQLSNLRLFPEKAVDHDRHLRLQRDPVLQIIYDNLEFKRFYLEEAEIMCRTEFLDAVLTRNEDKIEQLRKKVYRLWPFYDFPTQILYDHQQYMRSKLFPDDPFLLASLVEKDEDDLVLKLINKQDLPVEIYHLSWQDSLKIYPKSDVVVERRWDDGLTLATFRIPPQLKVPYDFIDGLELCYGILGLQAEKRVTDVLTDHSEPAFQIANTQKNNIKDLDHHKFLEIGLKQKLITIPPGHHIIKGNLEFPRGYQVEIQAGTVLDFTDQGGLRSQSPLVCNGTDDRPIIICSSDSTGGFIEISHSAGERSYFSHVKFQYLEDPNKTDDHFGIVSISQSGADFENCTFSGGDPEDYYLTFVESEFRIDACLFSDISGRALGLRSSKGSIANTSFSNIGWSAIEGTNSDIDLAHVFMNHVLKSGIKLDSESVFAGSRLDLHNTSVALEANDIISLVLTDSRLAGGKMGILISHREDATSKPPFVKVERFSTADVEIAYRVSPNDLTLNGDFFTKNVKLLEAQTLR